MFPTKSSEDLLWDLEKVKVEMTGNRSETDIWSQRQQLQDMCHSLLLTDLSTGLNNSVERDLWYMAFHQQIKALQVAVKESRGGSSAESTQANLSMFLDFAQGFFMQFLQELCGNFGVDMPFHACGRWFGMVSDVGMETASLEPSKAYICQYCLVHMGDISRYRHQLRQADLYYRYAAQLRPCNGQPYHQLGVLAAAEDQPLRAVFFYCRSLCVRYPFPSAEGNLSALLTKYASPQSEVKFSDLWLSFLSCAVRSVKSGEVVSDMAGIIPLLRPTMQGAISNTSNDVAKDLECVAVASIYCLVNLRPAEGDAVFASSETPWQAVAKVVMSIVDDLVQHLKISAVVLPAVCVLVQCLQLGWSTLSSLLPHSVLSSIIAFLAGPPALAVSQVGNPLVDDLDGLLMSQSPLSSHLVPKTCVEVLRKFCDHLIELKDRRIHCHVNGTYIFLEPRTSMLTDVFKGTSPVGGSAAVVPGPIGHKPRRPLSQPPTIKLAAVFSVPRVSAGGTRPK